MVSGAYLVRLAALDRRHADGLVAFGLSFTFALATLVLQIAR